MIVRTMTLPEMVADARQDYKALMNKVDSLLPKLRRMHLRDRAETISHLLPWRSPRGNNWLLHFSLRKAGLLMHPLVWSYDARGRIFGLIVTPSGSTYCLDNHLLQRYGERFDPTANPLQRLRNFFQENYSYSAECTEQVGEDRFKVQVGMCHGMGLGEWDRKEGLVYINTFVNHGQLFQNQADSMERMDFERLLHQLSASQRRHLVALYKRKYPEDVGKPGMEWLERFAA